MMKKDKKSEYNYSNDLHLVSQMKSWMAINPSFGCIWDCSYCIQHKDRFFDTSNYKRIQKLNREGVNFTPEDIVAEIMVNPRITSKTPLTFYNFSDPFLPQNTSDLIKILEGLDEREFRQIVSLITRTNAPKNTLDRIANLKNIKSIVFVSYAGYEDRRIESAPNNKRLELMARIHERGIPVIQYLRPVVQEWLEDGQFKKTCKQVKDIVDGVVMSGLRLTPEIIQKIQKRDLIVPKVPNHTNKYFPIELQKKIIDSYGGAVPIYRYTSCAVSSIFGIPDYNAHLDFLHVVNDNNTTNCQLPCIQNQRKICKEFYLKNKPTRKQIDKLANKIGYDNKKYDIDENGRVFFEEPMPKEDLTFFRHNISRHVGFKGKKHHFDQVHKIKK